MTIEAVSEDLRSLSDCSVAREYDNVVRVVPGAMAERFSSETLDAITIDSASGSLFCNRKAESIRQL